MPMPASLRKPKESRAPKDKTPDRLELLCACDAITLEAAAPEGEGEVIPRFTMVAYTGDSISRCPAAGCSSPTP